jgi:sporulation protein YlmC with PRC-barrel domain
MSNELRLNAQVICTDGPGGRLTDIVLDPATEQVTHLIVAVPGFGQPRHLVPASLLQASAGREVRLRCSRAELAQTEFFTETETLPLDASSVWYTADETLPWPLVFPGSATLLTEHERVPPGELAVDRDTSVEASDGSVGRLQAVVLHSNDDRVVDIILRRGHLWRKRDVVVPATAIERIDAEAVHLRLPKARILTLPSSPPGSAA